MKNNKELRLALPGEAKICYGILDSGRAFQREQGFMQWPDDYPNLEIVQQDIAERKGYVVTVDGNIAAYMCIDFDGEPAYARIDGAWLSSEKYAVVHRMAIASEFRGVGLAERVFALIEKLCRANQVPSLRADTDFPNERMQHILGKIGMTHCGTIYYGESARMAYEKIIQI